MIVYFDGMYHATRGWQWDRAPVFVGHKCFVLRDDPTQTFKVWVLSNFKPEKPPLAGLRVPR